MRIRQCVLVAVLATAAATQVACIGGKKSISAEDKAKLAPYILSAVPQDATKIDVNFENKIHLVGYKLEPKKAPPGTAVKVTMYWRADDPIEDGWQLFTHVQHQGFDRPQNLDNVGPLRELKDRHQVLGPDRWERGKIYADEQSFTMPKELHGPDSIVYVGIWKGDARLRIISGPNDGDNRAIVAKIDTGVKPKPKKHARTDIPVLQPVKLAKGETITVDGKADDAPWRAAASTGPFVDVGTGRPATSSPVNGAAKVAWDDAHLYVLIEVTDPDVIGYFTNKAAQPKDWTVTGQPMTWTKDTAEIMIDPDGDGDNANYFEIQIGPQNRGFHSRFDGYNRPKTEPRGPFGHEDWDPKLKSAVVVHGTIDKQGDEDKGYTVEAAIPWRAFEAGAKTLPPKPGDAWRMNFYAMKHNGGTAWSPILGQGNFHKASRFGRVVWATKEWLDARAKGEAKAAAARAEDAGPAHALRRGPARGPARGAGKPTAKAAPRAPARDAGHAKPRDAGHAKLH